VTTPATTEDVTAQRRGQDMDKRRAIIEAAEDLFTTAGYESTTMAQVAGRAGVGVGTVYLYFKNKNDLLAAVKDSWQEEVLRALSLPEIAALPYPLRARPMIEASFNVCARHTQLVQLLGMQAEMLGEWQSQAPEPIKQAIKTFLDEALAAGAILPIDTNIAATIVYGMVNSCLLECFCLNGGAGQQAYIDLLVSALQHWLINPALLSGQATQEG
jgi:AcrR family transcriptional regulator